jgi:hypothetical protein
MLAMIHLLGPVDFESEVSSMFFLTFLEASRVWTRNCCRWKKRSLSLGAFHLLKNKVCVL